MRRNPALLILALPALLWLAGCSSTSVERGAQGAVAGAAAGAVGSMFTAAIFGGDIGEAAARGAAWGAGAGAVGGAMQGSAEDARKREREAEEKRRRQAAEIEKLKSEIGEDAFAGLEALTVGKHEVAMAYARTAARSSNQDYALAGHWVEVLTYADDGDQDQVNEHLPHLVEMDPEIDDLAEARRTLTELSQGLADIRTEFGVST